ncbi:hypothetical protein [Vibrio sp. 10N.239.312.D08]|uniref:hypothetical protein n=1 Tax=Vibrio sp. 10N.239.312.D08 TaxID=3229978 RepID=UPI003551966D
MNYQNLHQFVTESVLKERIAIHFDPTQDLTAQVAGRLTGSLELSLFNPFHSDLTAIELPDFVWSYCTQFMITKEGSLGYPNLYKGNLPLVAVNQTSTKRIRISKSQMSYNEYLVNEEGHVDTTDHFFKSLDDISIWMFENGYSLCSKTTHKEAIKNKFDWGSYRVINHQQIEQLVANTVALAEIVDNPKLILGNVIFPSHKEQINNFLAWLEQRASIALFKYNIEFNSDTFKLPLRLWTVLYGLFDAEVEPGNWKLEKYKDVPSNLKAAYDYVRSVIWANDRCSFVTINDPFPYPDSSAFASEREMFIEYVGMAKSYSEYQLNKGLIRNDLDCFEELLSYIFPSNLPNDGLNVDSDDFYSAASAEFCDCQCTEPNLELEDTATNDLVAVDLDTPFRGRDNSRYIVCIGKCKNCEEQVTFVRGVGSFNTIGNTNLLKALNDSIGYLAASNKLEKFELKSLSKLRELGVRTSLSDFDSQCAPVSTPTEPKLRYVDTDL